MNKAEVQERVIMDASAGLIGDAQSLTMIIDVDTYSRRQQ